ncbi:GntR family transcriptional regulator [Microvirga massiliensis]|uniref:GntR family transcriptional regulator n=1 Tax=Microvirga massiliensis TaxID=1033741 RepID=UPI00093DA469|nr:GntR family transcriptional regulator [Microvirga massiliensis]
MTSSPSARPFRTKREYALDTLQDAIRSGRYQPGQQLRQSQLAQELGLGSTPLREAVLELLARGVLVQESHHSVRVAELDPRRLRNLYRVRALLETEAARLGVAKISDEAIASMSTLLDQMKRAKWEGDIQAVAQADSAFHRTLYEAADNPILLDLIDQVGLSFPGNILWNIPGRIDKSLKEHAAILKAVSQRDPTAAGSAIETHLLSGLAALESHVATYESRSSGKPKSKSTS